MIVIKLFHTLFFFSFLTSVQAATIDINKLSHQLKAELTASPLGDNINVPIFDFIVIELMKHQDVSKARIKDIEEQEYQSLQRPTDIKSYTAEISETQFHIFYRPFAKGLITAAL